MARIDERSTLPVSWFAIVLFTMSGTLITITFWVSKVNGTMEDTNRRLIVIENSLGLYSPKIPGREVATNGKR